MFRQKMAQVTNCSCRLIPNQSSEYMIFKTQNSNNKPINKEPKQKYSLKTQTASSSKHQTKVTSAHKTSLKSTKQFQDEKYSISSNLDPIKQKLQKNLICSPENSQLRRLDQNIIFASKLGPDVRNFTTMQNSIRTAQNNKMKQQKKTDMNSHNHLYGKYQQNKDFIVSNFGNHNTANSKETYYKGSEVPKKSLNFEQYYKYVSNPYAVSDKNKENVCSGDNPQSSRYKIDLRMKKQYRKLRNQTLPLQQINMNSQPQISHESLEKDDKQNIRNTNTGSLTTKNSMNSQNNSMKMSKYQTSLMNSKIVNLQQNPSLQFTKVNNHYQFDQHIPNQSLVFTQRNFSSNTYQANRNDSSLMMMESSTHRLNYLDGLASKGLYKKDCQQMLTTYHTLEHSKIDNSHLPLMNSNHPTSGLNILNKEQPVGKNIFIQKINTFTDIMNNTAECQSLIGEGDLSYNENEQSVVILRYKDLVEEVHGLSQFDHDGLAKPQIVSLGGKHQQKCKDNMMMDSIKILTNVKPLGKFSSNQDSTITCNQNMKKTVKVNKDYFTHNFSPLE